MYLWQQRVPVAVQLLLFLSLLSPGENANTDLIKTSPRPEASGSLVADELIMFRGSSGMAAVSLSLLAVMPCRRVLHVEVTRVTSGPSPHDAESRRLKAVEVTNRVKRLPSRRARTPDDDANRVKGPPARLHVKGTESVYYMF